MRGFPKSSPAVGIGGAILGSLCCALPAAAVAAGVGGASNLVALAQYQRFFVGASLLLVVGMSWYLARRREDCCETAAERRAVRYTLIATAICIYLAVYLIIDRLVVPLIYGMGPGMSIN
ncbi:MAG: hypothetical protein ACYC3S_09615 [Chloroflexota bacterium]